MKKFTLITLAIIWILSLTFLIIVLTGLFPGNIFNNYRLVVGFGFIAMSGFIGMAYRRLLKTA